MQIIIIIHMVAPLSGEAHSSGAIFRTKLAIIRKQRDRDTEKRDSETEKKRLRVAPSYGQNWLSSSDTHGGATEDGKKR